MSASKTPRFSTPLKTVPHFAGINPSIVRRWVPILGMWGVGAVGAVSLFASAIPLFKKDVLVKIPIIGNYYVDKTPDTDKPF